MDNQTRYQYIDWMLKNTSMASSSIELAKLAEIHVQPFVIDLTIDKYIWDDAETIWNMYQLKLKSKQYV